MAAEPTLAGREGILVDFHRTSSSRKEYDREHQQCNLHRPPFVPVRRSPPRRSRRNARRGHASARSDRPRHAALLRVRGHPLLSEDVPARHARMARAHPRPRREVQVRHGDPHGRLHAQARRVQGLRRLLQRLQDPLLPHDRQPRRRRERPRGDAGRIPPRVQLLPLRPQRLPVRRDGHEPLPDRRRVGPLLQGQLLRRRPQGFVQHLPRVPRSWNG